MGGHSSRDYNSTPSSCIDIFAQISWVTFKVLNLLGVYDLMLVHHWLGHPYVELAANFLSTVINSCKHCLGFACTFLIVVTKWKEINCSLSTVVTLKWSVFHVPCTPSLLQATGNTTLHCGNDKINTNDCCWKAKAPGCHPKLVTIANSSFSSSLQ